MGNTQNAGECLQKLFPSEIMHIFLNDDDRRENLLLA